MHKLMVLALATAALPACQTEKVAPKLPPPVAGLAHPAMARAGQPVLFDANPTRVAVVTGKPEWSARIQRFRFAVADGSAAVDTAAPQWSHAFGQPGSYDVSLHVWDDHGGDSEVMSRVLVVADMADSCTGTTDATCDTGLCGSGACLQIACAADVACDIAGATAKCNQGKCIK